MGRAEALGLDTVLPPPNKTCLARVQNKPGMRKPPRQGGT